MQRFAPTLLFLAPLAACAAAGSKHPAGDPAQSEQAFALMKSLVGDWRSTSIIEGHTEGILVSYELVANDSAVLERLFKGRKDEMVTIYHRDGDALLMTHYCSMGNQPRMALTSFTQTPQPTASFAFSDATNWNGPKEAIMHDMRVTSVDKNHMKTAWSAWADGKENHVGNFEFARVSRLGN